jgi:mannose-6-phosphate isomerase-like protein (cupin superfamily)
VPLDGIVVLGPDGGEHLPRGDRHHRVLGELPELEAVELRFGPGFDVPAHVHDDHADLFYIIAGEAEFLVGDEVVRAGAGSFVAAPAGLRHGFRNAGAGELRLVNIHTPPVGFVEELRAEGS